MYVPLPLSVTAPIVPTLGPANVTAAPPAARLFPLASFSCTVSVLVLVPFAVSDVGLAVTVLVVADAAPAVSVTVAEIGRAHV